MNVCHVCVHMWYTYMTYDTYLKSPKTGGNTPSFFYSSHNFSKNAFFPTRHSPLALRKFEKYYL